MVSRVGFATSIATTNCECTIGQGSVKMFRRRTAGRRTQALGGRSRRAIAGRGSKELGSYIYSRHIRFMVALQLSVVFDDLCLGRSCRKKRSYDDP